MTCKQHPTYKGFRKPRVACEECWAIYFGISETCRNCGCNEQSAKPAINTRNNDSDETTD